MSLVNYAGSSDEESDDQEDKRSKVSQPISISQVSSVHLRLPPPLKSSQINNNPIEDNSRITDDEDDLPPNSITLLSNLPQPIESFSIDPTQIPETELEDIVRADNKEYMKNLPQNQLKRKREPVKIFLPAIEQDDSDDDEKDMVDVEKSTMKKHLPLLNLLPKPKFEEEITTTSFVPYTVKKPVSNPNKTTTTSSFIPYTLKKVQSKVNKTTELSPSVAIRTEHINGANNHQIKTVEQQKDVTSDIDDEEDDDNDQTNFFSFTQNTHNDNSALNFDVETVLKETLPKSRIPSLQELQQQQQKLDEQSIIESEDVMEDDALNQQDEYDVLQFIPEGERPKSTEVIDVNIDSLLGESARQQLLRNITEEKELHGAQESVKVPTGMQRRKHQITYLAAKAKAQDLELKNMWSQNKMTKRQTQAKYGF